MADPFKISQPTCLQFSGGRSSAYMLWRTLDANGGFPAGELDVVYANTGREATATLDFVREVSHQWNVPIRWVEFRAEDPGFSEVCYEKAARSGEPFEAMVRKKQYLPNAVERFCTVELKIKPTEKLMRSLGWDEWDSFLGFRADEPARVAKVRTKPVLPESPGVERRVPLAQAGVTKATVRDFWAAQPFDLALPIDYDGTTIDGNCDGCFLKSVPQLVSAMQRTPSMPVWWARMEQERGARFTNSGPSYADMQQFAASQRNLDSYPVTETIACFCGD